MPRPTRTRVALWGAIAVLWFLLLPQHLATADDLADTSLAGAVVWAAVMAGLVLALVRARRRG